jgi:hypothetical protein
VFCIVIVVLVHGLDCASIMRGCIVTVVPVRVLCCDNSTREKVS